MLKSPIAVGLFIIAVSVLVIVLELSIVVASGLIISKGFSIAGMLV